MDYPEHIMIVGNGGRECALANAILLSSRVKRLTITPPNWGVLDPMPVGGKHRVNVLTTPATDIPALVAA
ncbi:hypothetical protein IIA79_03180, partial [bacterium]|nr:hypothetical protein [bacterium]